MICLDLNIVLFSINGKKGKFLERTLEPTQDYANNIYQGSAEIVFNSVIEKKTSCVTRFEHEEKKDYC